MSAVRPLEPRLNLRHKTTGGSGTRRKHENVWFHGLYSQRWLTVPHCSSASEQKLRTNNKNYLCTAPVTGASASAQVPFSLASVPLWHPNTEIPPQPRSSFSLDILLFCRSHMKSPVAEQGTGSQNVIRNVGAVGLHQKRHLGTP